MEEDNFHCCVVIYLFSPGGRFFDAYCNNGNEGEGYCETNRNRRENFDMSGTDAENAMAYSLQLNPRSSEQHGTFTQVEPIPPPTSSSDTSQHFFNAYCNSGNGGEDYDENSNIRVSNVEMSGTNNETTRSFSAQMNTGSSEQCNSFAPTEPTPPPPNNSDTSQNFGMIGAPVDGHNAIWRSTNGSLTVSNITNEAWVLETLRRAERIEYYRELFGEGKIEEGLRELANDPHAPTLVQITGDIRLVDLDAEIMNAKLQLNQP